MLYKTVLNFYIIYRSKEMMRSYKLHIGNQDFEAE